MTKFMKNSVIPAKANKLKIAVDEDLFGIYECLKLANYNKIVKVHIGRENASDHDLTLVHRFLVGEDINIILTDKSTLFEHILKRKYVIYQLTIKITALPNDNLGKVIDKNIRNIYYSHKQLLVHAINFKTVLPIAYIGC